MKPSLEIISNLVFDRVDRTGYCVLDVDAQHIPVFEEHITMKCGAYYYCVDGEAEVQLNMQDFTVRKGDFSISTTMSLCHISKVSPDFKVIAVMVNRELSSQIGMGISTELLTSIIKHPVISPRSESEREYMHNKLRDVELLEQIYSGTRDMAHIEAIVMSLRSFLRMFAKNISEQHGYESDFSFTSADNYFRSFIELLSKHVQTEHEVAFYANKLNITPKYLNEMTRRKMQYKAKEVISAFLVSKIKRELLVSGKSVKCLAFEYNFGDQSSFGKFFKKETGTSPVAFRRSRGIIIDDAE